MYKYFPQFNVGNIKNIRGKVQYREITSSTPDSQFPKVSWLWSQSTGNLLEAKPSIYLNIYFWMLKYKPIMIQRYTYVNQVSLEEYFVD